MLELKHCTQLRRSGTSHLLCSAWPKGDGPILLYPMVEALEVVSQELSQLSPLWILVIALTRMGTRPDPHPTHLLMEGNNRGKTMLQLTVTT